MRRRDVGWGGHTVAVGKGVPPPARRGGGVAIGVGSVAPGAGWGRSRHCGEGRGQARLQRQSDSASPRGTSRPESFRLTETTARITVCRIALVFSRGRYRLLARSADD